MADVATILATTSKPVRFAIIAQLPLLEGEAQLVAELDGDNWDESLVEWRDAAGALSQQADDPKAKWREFVSRLLAKHLATGFHERRALALCDLRQHLYSNLRQSNGAEGDWQQLAAYFSMLAREFEPGRASWLADQVDPNLVPRRFDRQRLLTAALPAVTALVMQGGAELRRSERARLNWTLAALVSERQDRSLLVPILRNLVRGLRRGHSAFMHEEDVWAPLEVALEHGNAGSQLAVDFAHALLRSQNVWINKVWAPLEGPTTTTPMCRVALLDALFLGEFDFVDVAVEQPRLDNLMRSWAVDINPSGHICAAWEFVMVTGHPVPKGAVVIRQPATLALALGVAHGFLPSNARSRFGAVKALELSTFHQWLEALLFNCLTAHGVALAGVAEPLKQGLSLFSSPELVAACRHRALSRYITASPTEVFGESRQLLALWPAANWQQMHAVWVSLVAAKPPSPIARQGRWPELRPELDRYLQAFLHFDWPEAVAGINVLEMLGAATAHEWAEMTDGFKVKLAGEIVHIDSDYVKGQLADPADVDTAMAKCLLYVSHEWVHHSQAIGHVAAVKALRATGGEATLMQLDLAADHAAICIVNLFQPRWSILALKDILGRGLVEFPTSAAHTPAARARKASRLVAIRADYLVRKHHPVVARSLRGYVLVDYALAGGPLFIIDAGPPFRVALTANVTHNHVSALEGAADPAQQAGEPVDRVAAVDAALIAAMGLFG